MRRKGMFKVFLVLIMTISMVMVSCKKSSPEPEPAPKPAPQTKTAPKAAPKAEPAAAASFAGALRAVQSGLISSDESVTVLVSGNGLKDVRRAQESVSGGIRVQPDLAFIRQALQID